MGLCNCKTNTTNESITYYIPPVSKGKVLNVYDGDTITITAYCDNDKKKQIYKFRVRLANIDCAEIKTNNDEEKEIAVLAREKLKEKILLKEVVLKNVKLDKYGRLLADVWHNNMCLNDWLIEERLAVRYDGRTKKIPKSWKKYYQNQNIEI
jgi:endonuclease YncB( thermonuclease family)